MAVTFKYIESSQDAPLIFFCYLSLGIVIHFVVITDSYGPSSQRSVSMIRSSEPVAGGTVRCIFETIFGHSLSTSTNAGEM